MSAEGEMASEGNVSCDSADDKEDGTVGSSLRRRKIVKCAKDKIEQGLPIFVFTGAC